MQQCGNPYWEPSQSTPKPGKHIVDQPGEPQLNGVINPIQSDLVLYHRLKEVSSIKRNILPVLSYGSFSQRSAFLQISNVHGVTTELFKIREGAI